VSDDGRHILYVVAGPLVDEFYFKFINSPGQGRKIWANTPQGGPNVNAGTRLALNKTGAYALIEDRYSPSAKNIWIVDTETADATLMGVDSPQVTRAPIVLFNPLNPLQVVLQGQIGGTYPTDGTESYSAFITGAYSARQLTQIGGNYPQANGAGSGFGFWFGGDTRYIYHTEYLPYATPFTKTLLMFDFLTMQESVVYRRPTGTEHGLTVLPATNATGSKIAFGFTEPNPTSGDGPAAFYVSQPTAPATAVPLSTPYPQAGRIQFMSDGNTAILQALNTANGQMELYATNTATPVLPPTHVGKALDTGETLARTWVARGAQRLVLGYRTGSSDSITVYNVPVNSIGTEVPFTTTLPYASAPGEDINDNAQFIAYAPVEGSRRMLRIMSTRAVEYSLPVMGSGSTNGVIQFRWLPQP